MNSIPVLTAAQIREADRRCIEEIGIPGVVLMDRAGGAVYEHVQGGPVGVVCGKGNNGGDGYVAARRALMDGLDVRVVALADPEELTGDAATFMRAYANSGGAIEYVGAKASVESAIRSLEENSTLIDAILGTGVKGEVRGNFAVAIEAWPSVYTVAVDVPSGLNADTGEICGVCIRADVTVSLQFMKQGFCNPAAAEYLGEVVVADIGIPPFCADDEVWAERSKTLCRPR